ncbi:MAG: bifunctional folylpolyglutamate synthase/dihydrofolate synthase [Marinilabiliaceae bacterium]
MDYKKALQYLLDQLPMYQRQGAAAYRADLGNALEMDRYFGHPHRKYRTIHVGGTNGKGSVSHLLASILQSAGYRTGLYTSPHLVDFRERIRVNGEKIPEEDVVRFVEDHGDMLENTRPSFFEMTMGMAFEHFARENVDVAVIEVGMGGRLDSTNIISPDLTVITNIGLDHTMFLGDTLEAIAREKAGIIKPGVPVVVGRFQAETADGFREKAHEMNAPLMFVGDVFNLVETVVQNNEQLVTVKSDRVTETFALPLTGSAQQENLRTVLGAVRQLHNMGYTISDAAVHHGIEKVVEQTGLKGRWQKIADHPLMICDTAHNADGLCQVVRQIESGKYHQVHIVWGMVNDKDVKEVLDLLPGDALYYFTQASIPRALDPVEILRAAREIGLKGEIYPDVKRAVEAAKKNASNNDLIFIGGSTFIVSEALEI